MKYLVTGSAGFIGYHVAKRLLDEGHQVVCIDNINNYYGKELKYSRLEELFNHPDWDKKKFEKIDNSTKSSSRPIFSNKQNHLTFYKADLEDRDNINEIFRQENATTVIHLAAQAGVRYSITNPEAYIDSNLIGFSNILDASKDNKIQHFVYASSSSVYGANERLPFSEDDPVDHPLSLYAATKKSNEMLAHSYSNIYGLPTTGLRFFTVYGPWGRPDMSLFLFTRAMLKDEQIDIYNHGNHKRDFTYIDDIVDGVFKISKKMPSSDEDWSGKQPSYSSSNQPWRIYNIANGTPINLMDFVEIIERKINKKAKINYLPMQPGDVPETHADISLLSKAVGYRPETSVEEGVVKFIDWYISYFGSNKI
tara:strand:+ start:2851 stop:3948 length:1098 start_codon:yes stop_codon:yes gene_type:complete